MIEALKQIDLREFMSRCWQTRFQKEGTHYVALSPFREEKTPSLYVSREKDGHWVYFDHGSGRGGTVIDAVMEYEGDDDLGRAIGTATRMAQEVGLLAKKWEPCGRPEKQDLEGLFKKLREHETTLVGDYLVGRGIAAELVERMISSGVVVLNRLHGSAYCCFAVRDAKGGLRSLYNRKINGSAKREKFLLGEQYPFCLDWKKSAEAVKIYLCEGIIDALSLLTLEEDACVLGFPGVHCVPKADDWLPSKAVLVEAFDEDEAGREAAKGLRQSFPNRAIERFDLRGTHDVNQLLCSGPREDRSPGKLSLEDRIAVALSDKSSRELANEYGVHHSRICRIRNEATTTLKQVWSQRRRGRQAKAKPSEEVESVRGELAETKRLSELQAMRIDWLELQVKMAEKRIEEAARKGKARKKKTSKRLSKCSI
ncbi:MAG: hypothetical protein GY807_12810 [Gammaproteobacteria bacterium]|nr:hypothetical protein [Gammaproteobacteria bacterium]